VTPGVGFSTELAGSLQLARGAHANDAARTALGNAPAAIRDSIQAVFAGQRFRGAILRARCAVLASLISGRDLQRRLAAADFAARAPLLPPDPATPEAHFQGELRRWRRRELTRIAWRDLAGWADLGETLADLTAFADTAIATALAHARRALAARYGEPRSAGGEVQPWSSSAWASSAAAS